MREEVDLPSVMALGSGKVQPLQKEGPVPGHALLLLLRSSALPPWSQGPKPAESARPSSSTEFGPWPCFLPAAPSWGSPGKLIPGPQSEMSTPNLSAAAIHVSYRKTLVPYSAKRIPCPPVK